MSTFLAPIHSWMFAKIQAQDALTSQLAALAVEKGWLAQAEAAAFQHEETRALPELVGGDIHGGLSALIEAAETRYVELAGRLLNGHDERLDALKTAAYAFGQKHAAAPDSEPQACYQALQDVLLDGMPCDGVNVVTDPSAGQFSWERRFDVHGERWAAQGRSAAEYNALRRQVMAGILADTRYAVATSDDQHYTLVAQA